VGALLGAVARGRGLQFSAERALLVSGSMIALATVCLVKSFLADDFRLDPRLPADAQTGEDVYAGNDLDRGHLARRSDLLWGTLDDARALRQLGYE